MIQPQAFKKYGILVGSDKFGNKYYENYEYKYARNRWIEFAEANTNISCKKYDELWIEWLYSVAIDPPNVNKESQEATDYDKVSLSRLDKVYKNPYNTSEEWIENNWLHLKGKDYEKIEYL
ncbi:MAG: NADH dehydrogenase 1 alpha subcomplex subunit 12 ndufa12/DAP13 [Marteilia pararefringens]